MDGNCARKPGVLIALATMACLVSGQLVGCSSFRFGGVPPEIDEQRAGILQDRYRDDGESTISSKTTGWEALAPSRIKESLKSASGLGPDPKIAKEKFGSAEATYEKALQATGAERQRLFVVAGAQYASAADRWPNSALEQDALFLAGESYFFADRLPTAEEYYALMIKKHPNSKYIETIDVRRFAIAQYWLELDRTAPLPFYVVNWTNSTRPWYDTDGHAYRVFDRIRTDDPTGRLADDATMAAANSYFKSGNFAKADEMYEDLRRAFPSSEHQFDAHFFGLKTKLLTYQGWDYSSKPLEQAEELVKQVRRQFPQQAESEMEFLKRAAAEVYFNKAERIRNLGRYYELKRDYRAASIYYEKLIKDFSDTPFAEEAAQRLPTFEGKPPSPPQPVPWLANLFPKRESAKPIFNSDEAPASSSIRRR